MTSRDRTYVVPSPRSEFVELARSKKGRLFRKQILRYGEFAHPNTDDSKLVVNEELADSLIKNFEDGICDIVQVPIVDGDNKHVEDPLRNIGEVVELQKGEGGVYAVIDARKQEAAEELGSTLIGASAMFHMDYKDTRSGKKVGPTLLHVAVTNRPYITNLDGFEELIAASADTLGETVVLTEESEMTEMTKDTALEYLRDEHGIDVAALLESGNEREEALVAALSNVMREAGATVTSDEDEVTIRDVAEAVIELSQEKLGLEARVGELEGELEKDRMAVAEAEVDRLISDTKILPRQRDIFVNLALTNRPMYEALLPDEALVSLSEDGATVVSEPQNDNFDAEVERLVKLANEKQTGIKSEEE